MKMMRMMNWMMKTSLSKDVYWGVDPGPCSIHLVTLKADRPPEYSIWGWDAICKNLLNNLEPPSAICIERIHSYGMATSDALFDTVLISGMLVRSIIRYRNSIFYIGRKTIVNHVCGTSLAKDKNVRQALINQFGKGNTGNVKNDGWAALAAAVTARDLFSESTCIPESYALPFLM